MSIYLRKLKDQNNHALYQNQGITYLGVFGSVARGEENSESDIDVLIDFDTTKTFFDLADIKFYFEDSLGRRVDLVRRKSLKPELKPYIERDLITIYEKN